MGKTATKFDWDMYKAQGRIASESKERRHWL
jgi:hypothetical protein